MDEDEEIFDDDVSVIDEDIEAITESDFLAPTPVIEIEDDSELSHIRGEQ